MSNFKIYTNFNIETTADSSINGLLNTDLFGDTLSNRQVFFGLKTDDNDFNGNLENNSFTLDCNYSDCEATISNGASGEDTTTVRSIYIHVPTYSQARTIMFSYKNTPLFSVIQQKKTYSYSYNVYIKNIGSNAIYPSITSNLTLTNSPSSWSAVRFTSGKFCKMTCYYSSNSDVFPYKIYMNDMYVVGEDKQIRFYDGELWTYGTSIKLFYFSGQNCKLQGTYNFPFDKTNNDQYITL